MGGQDWAPQLSTKCSRGSTGAGRLSARRGSALLLGLLLLLLLLGLLLLLLGLLLGLGLGLLLGLLGLGVSRSGLELK